MMQQKCSGQRSKKRYMYEKVRQVLCIKLLQNFHVVIKINVQIITVHDIANNDYKCMVQHSSSDFM